MEFEHNHPECFPRSGCFYFDSIDSCLEIGYRGHVAETKEVQHGGTTMKLQTRLTRILCGAALALTFSVVPATWAAPKSGSNQAASVQSKMAPVDINTATADQLKAVPGIGDAYAKRIIANRPYTSKNQLVSKGVLPQGVYDKVKGSLVAHHMKK